MSVSVVLHDTSHQPATERAFLRLQVKVLRQLRHIADAARCTWHCQKCQLNKSAYNRHSIRSSRIEHHAKDGRLN